MFHAIVFTVPYIYLFLIYLGTFTALHRSRVQCVFRDNRIMVEVRRIDEMGNEYVRELYGVKKGVNENISR